MAAGGRWTRITNGSRVTYDHDLQSAALRGRQIHIKVELALVEASK